MLPAVTFVLEASGACHSGQSGFFGANKLGLAAVGFVYITSGNMLNGAVN